MRLAKSLKPKAFTLVEVIVAISLAVIGVATTIAALTKINSIASIARNLSGATTIAQNQIDLLLSDSPLTSEYELDGVKMRRLVFFDGPARVTYTPPADWEYSSTNDNLLLLHPHGAPGEATIRRLDLARPETFDDETTKRLTEEVLLSVPRGATNVDLVSREKNPLIIERKETFLVIIKYDFYGEPQLRSVLFLDRKKDQLRFQLTSPRSNFQHLQEVFGSSYFSWQNL